MTTQRLRAIGAGALCVLLAGAAPVRAQHRFDTLSHERVAGVAGLEVVTVRDKTLDTCFTVFLLNASKPALDMTQAPPQSAAEAAVERDRRLSELSTEFESALSSVSAGAPAPDWLKYQWEGQKVQSAFERVLRETDLARLEAQIKQIAEAPKLAVSGPSPCAARAPSRGEPSD